MCACSHQNDMFLKKSRLLCRVSGALIRLVGSVPVSGMDGGFRFFKPSFNDGVEGGLHRYRSKLSFEPQAL